ncbi:thioesterase [Sphingobium sp. SCG-1]|uniref:acyl-CoA thioesterase n=1 Tax=Sphingobium sp. SCG-1 TaxID=2072936 RepID=UPI000CD6AE81|nr:thioesterase family protein [Sphingobium sp. SCG-1]AUW56946.1 thioesterase [Sphingobium sp. SCG-1]
MAKPESWRLELDRYPFVTSTDTRFRDLDIMGHINNVAMAGIFETARVRFHRHLGRHPQDQGVRWLVASVHLEYLQEAHYPDEITMGCAIGHVGNTSWQVVSAAFQNGECVAICDSVVVTHGPDGRRRVDDYLREAMAANAIREG